MDGADHFAGLGRLGVVVALMEAHSHPSFREVFKMKLKNMNILEYASAFRWDKQSLASVLSLAFLFAVFGSSPQNLSAIQVPQAQDAQAAPYAQQTPAQLQQLVAPIALYPDSLVAQILGASTFPEQVVEADRWVQAHSGLKGSALGEAVEPQSWDPSVKALAAFPSVLGNMDKNLSWTSSLGDAYYNQPQDVMDAVQVMRRRAQAVGNLKTSPQQTVAVKDSTISVEPANSEVVYIPEYDPWSSYGSPVSAWPGWYAYPGIWFGGPNISFGVGFEMGLYGGFEWGWPHWGFDWHNRSAMYNHHRYQSRSITFYNRNNFYRGNNGSHNGPSVRGIAGNRPYTGNIGGRAVIHEPSGVAPRSYNWNIPAARGYAAPHGQSGVHSSAFSGYQHGGQVRSFSSRGSSSLGRGAPRVGRRQR